MKLKGKVIVKGEINQISATFRNSKLVIEVTENEMYPQKIEIQFNQDKSELINTVNLGDEVEVSINLRGREWTSPQGEIKYFNSIEGWKIDKISSSKVQLNNNQNQTVEQYAEEDDDLPFN